MISFDFRDKIVFFRWTLCLMDKNGILCPSKNVTLACEHVSYLENGLVLMAQIFTIFSFCKYVQFRYHYGFQYSGQRKLFKKMCFPYTTIILAPSIMRYAILFLLWMMFWFISPIKVINWFTGRYVDGLLFSPWDRPVFTARKGTTQIHVKLIYWCIQISHLENSQV